MLKNIIIILSSLFIVSYFSIHEEGSLKRETVSIHDSSVVLSFSAVGDIMCHRTQFLYSYDKTAGFDFNPVFRVIKKYFNETDVTIGNLETVIADDSSRITGYPSFNSPKQLVTALKNAGFDHIVTANNHSNDQGKKGIDNTIKSLRENRLNFSGTRINPFAEIAKVYKRQNISYSILSYTFDVNYNPKINKNKKFINFIDSAKIVNEINLSRKKGAEVVIMFYHFGSEYKPEPNNYQKKYVRIAKNAGADVILACHPHVVQPVEILDNENSNLGKTLVTYSLGNFISNQRWRHSDGGVVMNFNIKKNLRTNELSLGKITFLPLYLFKGDIGNGKEFVVLPSALVRDSLFIDSLDEKNNSQMKLSYKDIKKQVQLYDSTLSEKEILNPKEDYHNFKYISK